MAAACLPNPPRPTGRRPRRSDSLRRFPSPSGFTVADSNPPTHPQESPMPVRTYLGKTPRIHPDAYVEDSAWIVGDVEIGAHSSVWFNAVVRGDVHFIRIGKNSNVQDLACLHVTHDTWPVIVGDDTSIAHGAQLHGCTIGNGCLVAIGAIVLDGAEVGDGCLVGAGALVTPRTKIPPRSLVLGSPARVVRTLGDDEVERLKENSRNYLKYQMAHRASLAAQPDRPVQRFMEERETPSDGGDEVPPGA